MATDNPVDIVISWVDGNDPVHKRKREAFTKDVEFASCQDVGGSTRFADIGEIRYCIASINRNLDFVRKIFIITDGQEPDLGSFLSRNFKGETIPIEIVDHKTIFRGYEEFLPTFNSRAIETLMWRIPGLSEEFIYLNDDFLIMKPCFKEDFFKDGKVICYADWYLTAVSRLLRFFKPKKNGHKPISFKESMTNALTMTGGGHRFLMLSHCPRALKRSAFEDFFSRHPEAIIRNIRHKLRHKDQYNSQEILYLNEYKAGRCIIESPSEKLLFMTPKRKKNYTSRKLKSFEDKQDCRFCCFNSLDQATSEDREMIISWIRSHLGITE